MDINKLWNDQDWEKSRQSAAEIKAQLTNRSQGLAAKIQRWLRLQMILSIILAVVCLAVGIMVWPNTTAYAWWLISLAYILLLLAFYKYFPNASTPPDMPTLAYLIGFDQRIRQLATLQKHSFRIFMPLILLAGFMVGWSLGGRELIEILSSIRSIISLVVFMVLSGIFGFKISLLFTRPSVKRAMRELRANVKRMEAEES